MNQPIQKEYLHQQKKANETEDCSDRRLFSSDKTSNYLPNDSQSQIYSNGSVILKGNSTEICEKNGYDQAQKNSNKDGYEQADRYLTYSKNDQISHTDYHYGCNYDSYQYTHDCNEYINNPYQNENLTSYHNENMTRYHIQNMNQYQEQYQNEYQDFYDNSNYYDISYPKYAYHHGSLQQSSAYAYQDPNHAKHNYFQNSRRYQYSTQYQQQNYSTNDNINQKQNYSTSNNF